MELWVVIFIIVAVVILATAVISTSRISKLRKAKKYERGLKMVPLLIHLPQMILMVVVVISAMSQMKLSLELKSPILFLLPP